MHLSLLLVKERKYCCGSLQYDSLELKKRKEEEEEEDSLGEERREEERERERERFRCLPLRLFNYLFT